MQQQSFISHSNRKNVRLVQIFGILHIITSVLLFSFGVVVLAKFNLNHELNAHAAPVWGIASFLITGILGVVVFCQPQNHALVISHNAFAIISSCSSAGILIASSFGIKYYDCEKRYNKYTYYNYNYGNIDRYFHYDPFECWSKTIRKIGQPIYGMLVALSTLELVFSIVSAVYGFRVFSCCASSGNCCNKCDKCENDCSCCCEYQDHTSQTYQLQSANAMSYQVHQQQRNYVHPQFQHPSPSYLQQIPHQQIGFSPTQQSQVVTSTSGQQFVLVPLSQIQALTPNQLVVTATVPSVPVVQGVDTGKPPVYQEQQNNTDGGPKNTVGQADNN